MSFTNYSANFGLSASQLAARGGMSIENFTVAALPSASAVGAGTFAYVTDANATTRGSTVAGGGSHKQMVCSDGSNWIIQ